jgi:beta-glucosidase/6-phospho-beta-glucosidase/beta-galactosidase
MKNTFLEFCRETMGYTFHSKKTGYQVYKFELYWSRFTPKECFEKFDTKVIEFKHIF